MSEVSRRDALRKIAIGGAAAATAPLWVETLASAAEQHAAHYQAASAQAAAWAPKALTPAQNETVIALAELIIPQTDTAGATKANVNRFIDAVIAEASPADRQKFVDGLAWMDAQTQRDAGAPFAKASAAHQTALLTALSTNKAPVGRRAARRGLLQGDQVADDHRLLHIRSRDARGDGRRRQHVLPGIQRVHARRQHKA